MKILKVLFFATVMTLIAREAGAAQLPNAAFVCNEDGSFGGQLVLVIEETDDNDVMVSLFESDGTWGNGGWDNDPFPSAKFIKKLGDDPFGGNSKGKLVFARKDVSVQAKSDDEILVHTLDVTKPLFINLSRSPFQTGWTASLMVEANNETIQATFTCSRE